VTLRGWVEGTGATDGGEKEQAQQDERHRNYVTILERMCGSWGVGGGGETEDGISNISNPGINVAGGVIM